MNKPTELRELAETLKRTVHLARTYSHGTGSIFEDAMTAAERMADRALTTDTTGDQR
jgi:hypothetical protein